jgi:hypothetical protein
VIKTLASLGLAFAAALTGCAASDTAPTGDGSGSDMDDPPPPPPPEMDPQGWYRVNSTFDIATNMPGAAGSLVNGLIDATDDQDDPMSWVVDQMLDGMEDGTVKDILTASKPFVIGYLNDQVTSLAPGLANTLDQLGDRMAELTHNFGVNEVWQLTMTDQTYVASSTADGVRFTVAGVTNDYNFVDYDIDNVIVPGMLVTIDRQQSKLGIGEHDLPLPWGKIAHLGLDVAVIPTIDPTASSLQDLLDHQIDCAGVGQAIDDALGFGGQAFWASVCHGGMGVAADKIYDMVIPSETMLGMHLVGTSRYKDTDADYKIDVLEFGNWTGTMTMDATDADLAQPAAYVGSRITNPL